MCNCHRDYQQSVDVKVLEEAKTCLVGGTPLGQACSSKGETQFTQKGLPIFKWFNLAATQEMQIKTTIKNHEYVANELRTHCVVIFGAREVAARTESRQRRLNSVK